MHTINDLVRNITNGGRAAHAFACEGMAGEARDAFVLGLVQGLECVCEDEGGRPCGKCPSCRQVAAGTSLDVVRMNKSQGSGKTSRPTYKVNDASEFIDRLSMGAYGRFLIGIIDDADSMSEVVQNKLLKTLEEPAPDTIIILAVSNKDNLLSTVRSRCSDVRIADYMPGTGTGAASQAATGDFQEGQDSRYEQLTDKQAEAYRQLAGMIMDRKSAFYEFRALLDKNVKSREEALLVLDVLEDNLRRCMTGGTGIDAAGIAAAEDAGVIADVNLGSQEAAAYMELAATVRMDIRREMSHSRALKRLFLETR